MKFLSLFHLSARMRERWPQLLAVALLVMILIVASVAFVLTPFESGAVQNPTLAIDMVTTGNTYDDSTNTMTVGSVDNCLTSVTPSTVTHNHVVHVVISNVEDLIGWQVRLNYIGDKMCPLSANFGPFTDNTTAQYVSFTNLPIVGGIHRDVAMASAIPPAPPDGTETPQTASFGANYNGSQDFAVSPDTPAKTTPDDTSYSAPSGGVLASLVLQVIGSDSGNQLFINVDDSSPNAPGSGVVFFNGTTGQDVLPPSSALGDGFHGEGVTCVPQDCTTQECPPIGTFGPPTRTPTATPTCCPTSPTVTPTATATATPTPTPTGVHDAGIGRLSSPTSVLLAPEAPTRAGRRR